MENQEALKSNATDLIVSASKSIVGVVPFAGSLLSELVGNIIPNQRIDRLSKYVKALDDKLSQVPVEKINSIITNEDFIDLIEEGFFQASRAISDERRNYIASIISNGIKDENIQFQESKYFLRILQELNDIEIIWLRSYLDRTLTGDAEFKNKHKNVLAKVHLYSSSDESAIKKAALQRSYKEHLERLELIEHRIQIDSKTGLPEFDKTTGKPKMLSSNLTTLGRLLLTQIGLLNGVKSRGTARSKKKIK